MTDPLDPPEIARRDFEVVRRGYDQNAVRAFLHQVSSQLARALSAESELTERLKKAESRAASAEAPDEAAMLELLGEETTRILSSAREAAAEIRTKAEQAAERIIADASAQVAQSRSAAVAEADKRLGDARAEADKILAAARSELERRTKEAAEAAERITAEAAGQVQAARDEAAKVTGAASAEAAEIVEAAKAEGKQLLVDAQEARERVLRDLSVRRKKARAQIEQLNAGRERLLQAYEVVRSTIDDATNELAASVTDARLAAAAAARRIAAEPDLSLEQLDDEVAATRQAGLPITVSRTPSSPDARREPAPAPAPVTADAPAAAPAPAPASSPPPSPVTAAPPRYAASPSDFDPMPSAEPPVGRGNRGVADPSPPAATPDRPGRDVAALVEPPPSAVADVPSEPAPSAGAQAPPDPPAARPPTGESPTDTGPGSAATEAPEPDAAAAVAVDASAPEPGVAPPESTGTDDAPTAGTGAASPAEPPSEVASAPAAKPKAKLKRLGQSDPGSGERAPAEPPSKAADVFARLHAEVEPTPESGAEADEAGAPEPDAAPAGPERAAFDARATALGPIERDLAKRLKRTLADEQNEVLDKLRRGKPSGIDELLPTAADHSRRWADAAGPALAEAANAGAAWVGGSAEGTSELATSLAESLVLSLRERIDRSFEASDGNLDDVSDRVRALYREWKNQRLPESVAHHAAVAYARGMFDATAPEAKVQWVADPARVACPDCDDNVLAGAISKGDEFPTGDRWAPAHPGCGCLVLMHNTV